MSAVETLTNVIRATMPACGNPEGWAPALHDAMSRFGVNASKDRVAMFLAQIAVESQEMNRLDENLSYSADRLMVVWPKRFPTLEVAQKYARNPHALADFVYSSRMGNGDAASGDGYRFRGRGLKMLTGKDNYVAAGQGIGVDLVSNPDALMTKAGATLSACWFWTSRGLSELADDLPDDDQESDFVTVTRRINGGTIGLEKRQMYWARARKALNL